MKLINYFRRAYLRYLIQRGEVYAHELYLTMIETDRKRDEVIRSLRRVRTKLMQLEK